MADCADCGAEIEPRRKAEGWVDANGMTICRGVVVDGKLLWADYHYVEGGEQRHFKAPERDG